jgi:Zn-dependent peptidase ImmA (M78 family)
VTLRVAVEPKLLSWACQRARWEPAVATKRFPKFEDWLSGQEQPTLKQLETFAKATHTPVGYLFLPQPPVEEVPIPDFRTMGSIEVESPSPDLLDTVYTCQQRQDWYQEFARVNKFDKVRFVGSATTNDDVVKTAVSMRKALGFDLERRKAAGNWEEALRQFVGHVDDAGVLVMVNGVVGNNTHRKLDPEEFRGFALADALAPLVFINGADSKSAQMFTLAHELAHLWLGETALTDVSPASRPTQGVERWCNQVAAEFLVPLDLVKKEFDPQEDFADEVQRLVRLYKVSSLVILRRLFDAKKLNRDEFDTAYSKEVARLKALAKSGGGGDFYNMQNVRTGKRFARAVILSTLEGQTLYRDAYKLLGVVKQETFNQLGQSLGIS